MVIYRLMKCRYVMMKLHWNNNKSNFQWWLVIGIYVAVVNLAPFRSTVLIKYFTISSSGMTHSFHLATCLTSWLASFGSHSCETGRESSSFTIEGFDSLSRALTSAHLYYYGHYDWRDNFKPFQCICHPLICYWHHQISQPSVYVTGYILCLHIMVYIRLDASGVIETNTFDLYTLHISGYGLQIC